MERGCSNYNREDCRHDSCARINLKIKNKVRHMTNKSLFAKEISQGDLGMFHKLLKNYRDKGMKKAGSVKPI